MSVTLLDEDAYKGYSYDSYNLSSSNDLFLSENILEGLKHALVSAPTASSPLLQEVLARICRAAANELVHDLLNSKTGENVVDLLLSVLSRAGGASDRSEIASCLRALTIVSASCTNLRDQFLIPENIDRARANVNVIVGIIQRSPSAEVVGRAAKLLFLISSFRSERLPQETINRMYQVIIITMKYLWTVSRPLIPSRDVEDTFVQGGKLLSSIRPLHEKSSLILEDGLSMDYTNTVLLNLMREVLAAPAHGESFLTFKASFNHPLKNIMNESVSAGRSRCDGWERVLTVKTAVIQLASMFPLEDWRETLVPDSASAEELSYFLYLELERVEREKLSGDQSAAALTPPLVSFPSLSLNIQ